MYQSVRSALVHTVDQIHGARLEADTYLGGEDAGGSDSWPRGGCSRSPAPDPGSWVLSWLSGRVSSRQREQPVQRSWGWRKRGMFEGGREEKGKVSWAWGRVWEQPVFCPESKKDLLDLYPGSCGTFSQESFRFA